MLALSLREPWIFAIQYLGKDIENRTWPTKVRERIYLHASKQFDHDGYRWIENQLGLSLPDKNTFKLGGIVGSVEIIDCVKKYDSRWYFGHYGFVLKDPKPTVVFIPYKGRLGFFEVNI